MQALLPWMGMVRREWAGGGAKPQAAVLAAMILSAAAFAAGAETPSKDGPDESPRVETVAQTFNEQPFDYRMTLLSRRSGSRVFRLTYPSPVVTPVAQNNTIPADYYLPDGIAPGDPPRPGECSFRGNTITVSHPRSPAGGGPPPGAFPGRYPQ